jgi:hypothetical protein
MGAMGGGSGKRGRHSDGERTNVYTTPRAGKPWTSRFHQRKPYPRIIKERVNAPEEAQLR